MGRGFILIVATQAGRSRAKGTVNKEITGNADSTEFFCPLNATVARKFAPVTGDQWTRLVRG